MHTLLDGAPPAQALSPAVAEADDGGALYVQGLLALRDSDAERAASLFTQALRRQPTHTGMRRNLVRALLLNERFEQVLIQANAALSATPNDAEMHFARGTALNALGQPASACAAFGRALALQPNHAASWLNMGNASVDLDDLTSAEALYRTAISLQPDLPEAHASLGFVLTMQGQLPDAVAACEAAIRVRPDFAQAHWNLAIAALLSGDLVQGFREYEWRKQHRQYGSDFPDLPGRQWDGSDVQGKTVLVRAEQGFGDVIQFARYMPLLQQAGASPVLICPASLVPLVRSMPGVEAVPATGPIPGYDVWIDQISLPRLFGTTLATIPAATAYLSADAHRSAAWRARLPGGRKVGIALAGNPKHNNDRRRSVPPELAAKLPALPGWSFVSLQYGSLAATLRLPDLTPWMTDYAETAALIDNLDLVISVDTSVAHLAGALGKPLWIMLPHAPDWRWLTDRTDSPWYASVRLFRQTAPGDWVGVLNRVAEELRLFAGDQRTVC